MAVNSHNVFGVGVPGGFWSLLVIMLESRCCAGMHDLLIMSVFSFFLNFFQAVKAYPVL